MGWERLGTLREGITEEEEEEEEARRSLASIVGMEKQDSKTGNKESKDKKKE